MFIAKKERNGSLISTNAAVYGLVCFFTIYGILTFMSFPALTYGSFPENFQSDPVRRQSIDV